MASTIHLCTVVGGSEVSLLARLIRHYTYLGVNGRFLVAVHMASPRDPVLDRVTETLSPLGVDVTMTVVGPWRHRVNPGAYAEMRNLYPSDWAIIADHDEFHVYPDDLQTIVNFCERHAYNAVMGTILDRVSVDGTLVAVKPGRSLWATFPVGCELTRAVIDDAGSEVVLAKGGVAIGWGNHFVHRGMPSPRSHIHVPVHHFKWDASVLSRLRRRYALYRTLAEPYAEESAELTRYIAEHGRVPIEDKRLRARYVGNPYRGENLLD